jgi:hypothetical protein
MFVSKYWSENNKPMQMLPGPLKVPAADPDARLRARAMSETA